MKITVLGSGTSAGVPVLGKNTPVNLSTDAKDKRLRSSLYIEGDPPFIIDTGPDFRMQMIRHGIDNITHVLLTHSHYDHIGGLDDLRPLTFKNPDGISCFSDKDTRQDIINRYRYFYNKEDYYGKPRINFHILPENSGGIYEKFNIGNNQIQPIKLRHVESMNIFSTGFVFNEKFGYLTDFRDINEEYLPFLYNLDTLIIGAPLPEPHPNHLSIKEAVDLIQSFKAKRGYITHLADQKFHKELESELPEGIYPAYDGLIIEVN